MMMDQISYPADLPIISHKDEIIKAIRRHPVVIIAGDTGSGKSTQLPKMCLSAGRGQKKMIGCTQPRRLAAISVAARVAHEMGEAGAKLVGYKIRFCDHTSRTTRIKFMTDGILLAETSQNHHFGMYDTIIIDEAHERSLNIDFLLGMLQQVVQKRRDLRVIITSATIDTEKFANHFNGAPIIQVSGRSYPVEVRYQPFDDNITAADQEKGGENYLDGAVKAVCRLRQENLSGDILLFMPTERDIIETVTALNRAIREEGTTGRDLVLPLFGRLSSPDQARIFKSVSGRKIVVATNVAETSITVPGIRYVVDTGLARISGYNVRTRTRKLPVTAVSRASCDQRKGRCGRVAPGICVRLYSEENYQNRPLYTPPEIQRSNLAEVILRMIFFAVGDVMKFPFIDPPSVRAINDGYALLSELGAIDRNKQLTKKGRLMAQLPLDPRIARMIIEGRTQNALKETMIIAAALSVQDPRIRPVDRERAADEAHSRFMNKESDFSFFLKLWQSYHQMFSKVKSQSKMRKFCKSNFLSYQRMRQWQDIYGQIADILQNEGGFVINQRAAGYESLHRALLSGNLRNIGVRKVKNMYQGASGSEVMIFPGSALFNQGTPWIMAAELVETTKLYARIVAMIKPEWIEVLARDLSRFSYSEPHWQKKRGQVAAYETVTLFGLVIVARRQVNFAKIEPETARQIFIQSALVEAELAGGYNFFNHNQQLLSRLRKMEDQLRCRDIVVDDCKLYQFYDQGLPAAVVDQPSLVSFLKKKGSDDFLRMSEGEITYKAVAEKQLVQFPHTLVMSEFSLPLVYRFVPGSFDDGITVTIPLDLLPHCAADFFEWLVPGMLLDKIIFLLKGLPKNIRRQLIPVADTARQIMGDLTLYRGSLYSALAMVIKDSFRLRIEPKQWPVNALPDHLKMRYSLVDSTGTVIKTSRLFKDLQKLATADLIDTGQDVADNLDLLRKKWEVDEVVSLDLLNHPVPAKISVTNSHGQVSGFVYPALVSEHNAKVALRLFTSPQQSKAAARKGLAALYLRQFSREFKASKKDFTVLQSQWQLYEGIADHKQINKDILSFILEEIFELRGMVVVLPHEFKAKVLAVKKEGFFVQGKKIFDLILTCLQQRRTTVDTITRLAATAGRAKGVTARFVDYHEQVQQLLPHDFLRVFDAERLSMTGRYLETVRIRATRACLSPAKDMLRAKQILPHEQRLRAYETQSELSAEKSKLLTEYREMIEEFKISLFAQELKTAFPVSAKRLDKKWLTINECD